MFNFLKNLSLWETESEIIEKKTKKIKFGSFIVLIGSIIGVLAIVPTMIRDDVRLIIEETVNYIRGLI